MEIQFHHTNSKEFTTIKLSRNWINKAFVDLADISDHAFIDALTMLGHTVNSYETDDSDTIFELSVSPKRPDCCSVIGLTREVAAVFNRPMKHHEPVVQGCEDSSVFEWIDVDVPADELCNRYTCRLIRNVKIGPSSDWLRQRLISAGITPVNNIIDITNYVMLECGQPIHILDYRCVSNGELIVREAIDGESLETSDGALYHLRSGIPVITTEDRVVSLAGIVISKEASISEDTETVIIAAANFRDDCIQQMTADISMQAQVRNLVCNRMDPLMTVPAIQRVCELVETLGCGEVLDGMIDVLNYIPEPRIVEIEPDKISKLLGNEIEICNIPSYLKRLEILVEDNSILLPSFRGDLISLDDIAAEVMRLYDASNRLMKL